MIEVLHVLGSLDYGGVETLLLNYYRHIDRTKIHWNIVCPMDVCHVKSDVEKAYRELGASIHYIPRKIPNFYIHLAAYIKVIKSSQYDIVHCHIDEFSVFYVAIARLFGIRVRIVHCHIAHTRRGFFFELCSKMVKPFIPLFCTDRFACSLDAAKFLFGNTEGVYIMHNAIDSNRIKYIPSMREALRNHLGINNSFVVGCIARFHWQKNHKFLIEIFASLVNIKNCSLILVGEGPLYNETVELVKKYRLQEKVHFVGTTNCVEEYLSAMDCFVLPSRYEGLGIVYVEAQAADIETFATEERVPHEVSFTERMHFISERKNPKEWAEQIISFAGQNHNSRRDRRKDVCEAGYEIMVEALRLQKKYISLMME